MEFIRKNPEEAKELSEYLHPIWHEVFDDLMPGGFGEAEYIFQTWTCPEAIADSIRNGYEYGFIEEEGVRIGLYSYHILDDGRFYINKIYLESQFRGKGLGQKSLAKMIEIARTNNCHEIFLNVYFRNKRAIRAYEKSGMHLWYRCLGWIGNGIVRNDYLMKMDL